MTRDEELVELATQLEGLREEARLIGFDGGRLTIELESAEDLLARLKAADDEVSPESADDFVARMRARDEEAGVRARRRRRRLISGAVAVAAAAVAVAVVIRPGGTPVVADPLPILDYEFAAASRIAYAPGQDPTEVLTLLADAATATPDTAGAGPIQHVVSDNWFAEITEDEPVILKPRLSETWLRPDGSLRQRDSVGPELSPDGRGLPTEAPETLVEPSESELPAGEVDAGLADDLSTDPDRLRDQLLDRTACEDRDVSSTRTRCLFSEVQNLFRFYVVPPKLAAAVWTMLQGEADLSGLGSTSDRAGREGVGLSFIDPERPEYRQILIGSIENGQLLGHEVILIRPIEGLNATAPSIFELTAILSSKRTTDDG